MEVEMCIEIPYGSDVKYEIQDGKLVCDRILHTPMNYRFNYGYIVDTLADDNDHLDAVLLSTTKFVPNCYIRVRIIGALITEDEEGMDEKILVIPVKSVDPCPGYTDIYSIEDLSPEYKEQIKFFFKFYKKLEKDKWIRVGDFVDTPTAIEIYNKACNKYTSLVELNCI